MTIKAANSQSIREAAMLLHAGGLVAMPTETVYGLAANAMDGKAVAKIFEAKGRPSFNPLIVHVADVREAEELVDMDDRALAVANAFWPGPLTLILPRRDDCEVSELVSAGLPTLAVRVPRHKVTQDLIKASGVPLAAPSANRSGSLSPTAPIHVADSLGENVDFILAAGPSEVGLESTVLDLSGERAVILRPGAVTAEELSDVLEQDVLIETGDTDKPKSPGMVLKHYAPETPVRLNAVDLEDGEALLAFGSTKFMGLKSGGAAKDLPDTMVRNLSERGDLHEAAANLFAYLKELDQEAHQGIAVMSIPNRGLGIAMNDRLRRAAQGAKQEGLKAS
jgi:L-threonylcarbamoyladenylate synthase